ncbi:hypothetical protein LZ31DRAFT_559008 [Colletotrichum somersetense]|nr:hypothetical protein LZ31DRAFT_559008 [Colletotrichum somersetense]
MTTQREAQRSLLPPPSLSPLLRFSRGDGEMHHIVDTESVRPKSRSPGAGAAAWSVVKLRCRGEPDNLIWSHKPVNARTTDTPPQEEIGKEAQKRAKEKERHGRKRLSISHPPNGTERGIVGRWLCTFGGALRLLTVWGKLEGATLGKDLSDWR